MRPSCCFEGGETKREKVGKVKEGEGGLVGVESDR